jgi:ATP-dependent Clp protease protease subunit
MIMFATVSSTSLPSTTMRSWSSRLNTSSCGEDPTKDIWLYINSPGGSMTSMFAIYDTMQYVGPDVGTVCTGMAASAASVILAGGAAGKRFILPNARVLIHQPHGGAQGQSADIEIQAKEIVFLRRRMEQILSTHTGKPLDEVTRDTDRDFIMSAEESVAYGMVDDVLTSRAGLPGSGVAGALVAAAGR